MSGIAFSEIEEAILQSRQTTQVKKQVNPDSAVNSHPLNRWGKSHQPLPTV
jgi:hypothetical protein